MTCTKTEIKAFRSIGYGKLIKCYLSLFNEVTITQLHGHKHHKEIVLKDHKEHQITNLKKNSKQFLKY